MSELVNDVKGLDHVFSVWDGHSEYNAFHHLYQVAFLKIKEFECIVLVAFPMAFALQKKNVRDWGSCR